MLWHGTVAPWLHVHALIGLVRARRKAQTVHYRIADPNAARLLAVLKEIYCP